MMEKLPASVRSRKSRCTGLLTACLIVCLPAVLGALPACTADFVPKPKGYPQVALPAPAYKPLALAMPYTFRQSTHAIAAPDSDGHTEPGWIDLYYPAFDATVEFTYKPLQGGHGPDGKTLNSFIEDARRLANKHQVKASAIDEQQRRTLAGNRAILFRLSGQVPTQVQFYVTDSARHFLRGALYFKTATKNDSLAPMIDFIARDMDTLLATLQWRR